MTDIPSASPGPADLVVRVEPLDLLRDDEVALLLYGGTLVRLELLGLALFDDAEQPIRLDALAARLEERFGVPPEGTLLDATQAAVTTLLDRGVLRSADADDDKSSRGPADHS